ncbi:MAG: hypothetical protein AAB131_16920 [Actinomycetota bacterium]
MARPSKCASEFRRRAIVEVLDRGCTVTSLLSISTLTPTRRGCWRSGLIPAGKLLEVIWLELAEQRAMVIHAMPLRWVFYDLLPEGDTNG